MIKKSIKRDVISKSDKNTTIKNKKRFFKPNLSQTSLRMLEHACL